MESIRGWYFSAQIEDKTLVSKNTNTNVTPFCTGRCLFVDGL